MFAIECHLPKPPINLGNFDEEGSPAAGYIISVSNDKVHESVEALKLITFDSVCQDCNISHGCSLKVMCTGILPQWLESECNGEIGIHLSVHESLFEARLCSIC